jgi:hypothetical protein
VVAGSGVRCSAASGSPPGASGSPPGASGSPSGASGSPPGASGSPLHARDLQLGSLVGLDFTPDGSLVLAEKLTAKHFRLLRIHSSGSVDVIHAGDGGLSGNKTAGPTVVDIASMAVSPGGDIFLADNTQLKIFSLDMSNNDGGGGQSSTNNVTTVIDRAAGQSYQFNKDGLHVATRSMATGQLAYTFHYTTAAAAKGKMPTLTRIEDPLGNQVTVIRDVVSSRVEAIQNALGITFPVKLNKQGRRKMMKLTRLRTVATGDTHSETGGPARLPTQVAGRRGQINRNSVR